MIVVTSLSPSHSNAINQIDAVNSWQQFGECYSLNSKKEIELLEPLYHNITFIETDKTLEHLVGKPQVNINAFFEFAKGRNEDLFIINSDIIINELPEFKQDGITIFSRYDYMNSFQEGKIFNAGYDAFYIPNDILGIFPPSIYCLGSAWHDYATVIRAMLKNIPVYWPQNMCIFHKVHPTQYDYEQWILFGEYFRLDFKASKQFTIPQLASHYLNLIKEKSIKI